MLNERADCSLAIRSRSTPQVTKTVQRNSWGTCAEFRHTPLQVGHLRWCLSNPVVQNFSISAWQARHQLWKPFFSFVWIQDGQIINTKALFLLQKSNWTTMPTHQITSGLYVLEITRQPPTYSFLKSTNTHGFKLNANMVRKHRLQSKDCWAYLVYIAPSRLL